MRYGSYAEKAKVLLYNFFEDSTATLSQWRLVLNDVDQMGCNHKAPVFDDTRHANICLEVSGRCHEPLGP